MISLDFNVDKLIHDAMSSGDKQSLKVYRLMKAEFLKKQKEANRDSHELTEKEKEFIILKMISERSDSVQQYRAANREDLATEENKELQVLFKFFPKLLADNQMPEAYQREIASYKNDVLKGEPLKMEHMRPIMTILKEKYVRVDGKLVSTLLKDAIG